MSDDKPPRFDQRERHRILAENQRLYRLTSIYPNNPAVNNEGMPWVDYLIETPERHWHTILHVRDEKYRRLKGAPPPSPLYVNGEEVDVEFYLKKYREQNP